MWEGWEDWKIGWRKQHNEPKPNKSIPMGFYYFFFYYSSLCWLTWTEIEQPIFVLLLFNKRLLSNYFVLNFPSVNQLNCNKVGGPNRINLVGKFHRTGLRWISRWTYIPFKQVSIVSIDIRITGYFSKATCIGRRLNRLGLSFSCYSHETTEWKQ